METEAKHALSLILFFLAFIMAMLGLIWLLGSVASQVWSTSRHSIFRVLRELNIITISYMILIVVAVITLGAVILLPSEVEFAKAFSTGFISSLFEDILFFAFLGLLIIFYTRIEFYKKLTEEERIKFLFDAKQLTAEEIASLKRRLPEIACNYLTSSTIVEIRDIAKGGGYFKLDVSREFLVGNYFSKGEARYDWLLNVSADAGAKKIAGQKPIMKVHESRTFLKPDSDSASAALCVQEITLHQYQKIYADNPRFSAPAAGLPIPPLHKRIIRSRYEAWQEASDINKPINATTGTGYVVRITKEWSAFSTILRNSSSRSIRYRTLAGDIVREGVIRSGDQIPAFNFPDGVQLGLMFEIQLAA